MSKRWLAGCFFVIGFFTAAQAQTEVPQASDVGVAHEVKTYDGFLFDVRDYLSMPAALGVSPFLHSFKADLKSPSMLTGLYRSLSLKNYTLGRANSLSLTYPYHALPVSLYSSTHTLGSGWQLTSYGQYNDRGVRLSDRSLLPWQRNDFRGAFELKSPNGNFGFRLEVQQGHRAPGQPFW